MKKSTWITHVLFILLAMCVTTAQAADFFLSDSDGDLYHVGEFLGNDLNNDLYRIQLYENSSSFPTSEGVMFYNEFYRSVKISIYENNDYFGFTLEGHWNGNGSTMFFAFNERIGERGAELGEVQLFMGDRLPRKGVSKTSAKKRFKKNKLDDKK